MAPIIDSLQMTGLNVVHIFPPQAVIVEAGDIDVPAMQSNSMIRLAVRDLSSATVTSTKPANELAFAAWKYITDPANATDGLRDSSARLLNCQDDFSDIPLNLTDQPPLRAPMMSPTGMITGNFMLGRIAVKMVLMESSGPAENWGPVFENKTVSEIVQGLDWLSSQAERRGQRVSWVYDVSLGVPTDFEPIQEHSVPYYSAIWPPLSWEFKWLDDAFSYLGFSSEWDGAFALANYMRRIYQANWGFSVFVAMDNNDPDHKFTDGKYAKVEHFVEWSGTNITKWPGCVVVMTYNNGGIGPNYMDEVLRHEVGHIFRAADEYEEADDCHSSACDDAYGYLRVDNGNCEVCNPNSVDCSMKFNDSVLCDYSVGQLGWRDTTGDGVSDAIQPSNGGWMSVPNLNLGDLVRIYTVADDFVNLIAVTSDNMATQPANYVIWDGHNYDDQACAPGGYKVTINNGGQFQRQLHGNDPVTPAFTGISYTYTSGNLNWSLSGSFAYVRCFIYNASNNLIARPIWDKLYSANYPQSLDVHFLPPGQTYTARFFGWCPDGGKSQTVNYSFAPCTSCGDANSDNSIDLSDVVFLIAYIYSGGAAPGDCNYPRGKGDANGDGTVDISDVTYLIARIFSGGPAPHCYGL